MNPKSFAFYRVITEAVNDISAHGFDSETRVKQWAEAIRKQAEFALLTPAEMETLLRSQLGAIYGRLVTNRGLLRTHDIPRYTLENLAPKLRNELDKRLMASAQLIRLNREEMITKTVRRFVGWATSVPDGGSKNTDKVEAKQTIRKALAGAPFEQRRVLIDQGHKLTASINEIVATDAGAIAGEWHSHWRQPGYDYREDHKERDMHIYAIRGNWAIAKGLMKPGPDGYYDSVTAVGEEPFCRCFMKYIYAIRRLPDDMLTAAGRKALTVKVPA